MNMKRSALVVDFVLTVVCSVNSDSVLRGCGGNVSTMLHRLLGFERFERNHRVHSSATQYVTDNFVSHVRYHSDTKGHIMQTLTLHYRTLQGCCPDHYGGPQNANVNIRTVRCRDLVEHAYAACITIYNSLYMHAVRFPYSHLMSIISHTHTQYKMQYYNDYTHAVNTASTLL